MAKPLAGSVIKRMGQAAELYHRLVMLVAPSGAGKTAALQDVHDRTAVPLVNVNLELSRRLLDLTERQRALQLPRPVLPGRLRALRQPSKDCVALGKRTNVY
jgi:hypothetical protein